MFDHLDEEVAGEKVQAQGGVSPRQMSNRGGPGKIRETWLGYPETLPKEIQAHCLLWVIFVLVAC